MSEFWNWEGNDGIGYVGDMSRIGNNTIYSGSATFSSGSTATSSNTFMVGALTASKTTTVHGIFISNNGPYAMTATLYKTISAGGTSFNADADISFTLPASADSAGVTIGGKETLVQGIFNYNQGLILRLTVTAAFTALVTNNVIIKEL
ncbi:MAG: hypothetical protein PHO15_00370 [Eubacteriales bacterium]|nr:hypothetical protein [Eubacteriales bacterium]